MEITKVGVIGAGAIGAYFLWGMRELPREDICLIAKGERKERLIRNGIIINGERYDYPVKEPQEAGKVEFASGCDQIWCSFFYIRGCTGCCKRRHHCT